MIAQPLIDRQGVARERHSMYSVSKDSGRRPSPTGPARSELPILFHLTDVSRSRAFAIAPAGPQECKEIETAIPTGSVSLQPTFPASNAPPAVEAPSPATIAAVAVLEPEFQVATDSATAVSQPPVSEPSGSHSPTSATEIVTATEVATANAPAANPYAAAAPKVTLAGSGTNPSNRRRSRTPASEDWFASHGKFIAIAFVVALIGTVYFARTTRQQVAPAKTEAATTQSPLVEAPPPGAAAGAQSIALVSDSRVELQAPSAPPLISAAAETKAAGGDKLFDFPNPTKQEVQVASRQDRVTGVSPSSESSPTQTSQLTASSEAQATSTAAPELAAAYPVTSSPAANYPTTAATTVYPQTSSQPQPPAGGAATVTGYGPGLAPPANTPPNYGAQSSPPAAQSGSPANAWVPSAWTPSASTAPYQPPTPSQPYGTTASGPRYERTGSGRY